MAWTSHKPSTELFGLWCKWQISTKIHCLLIEFTELRMKWIEWWIYEVYEWLGMEQCWLYWRGDLEKLHFPSELSRLASLGECGCNVVVFAACKVAWTVNCLLTLNRTWPCSRGKKSWYAHPRSKLGFRIKYKSLTSDHVIENRKAGQPFFRWMLQLIRDGAKAPCDSPSGRRLTYYCHWYYGHHLSERLPSRSGNQGPPQTWHLRVWRRRD